MDSTVVGIVVFACTFGGVLLGMWLRTVLPERHFDSDSKDTVKVGIGLIATMTALVLGLVTASAKSSFDAVDTAVKQAAMQILVLDRALARYGPETAKIRAVFKQVIGARIDAIWGKNSSDSLDPLRSGVGSTAEALPDAIRDLKPTSDAQRAHQSRALELTEALLQARWIVLAGTETSIPLPFLVALLFWLAITFTSFGLFAPRNYTVHAVLLVCAISVSSAVFLVLEMDKPFEGVLKISADPMHYAYDRLNR